jgi:integrase
LQPVLFDCGLFQWAGPKAFHEGAESPGSSLFSAATRRFLFFIASFRFHRHDARRRLTPWLTRPANSSGKPFRGSIMRAKLTSAFVQRASCPPGKNREVIWDATMAGFGLMVTSTGAKSFVAQGRPSGSRRSVRATFKGSLPLSTARREAKRFLGDLVKGIDPVEQKRAKAHATKETFRHIAESYLKREGAGLRSIAQRRSTFERLVYPVIGSMPVTAIKRSHLTKLQDKIEDENGPRAADLAHDYVARVLNWYAVRTDNFNSPVVRGMPRRSKAKPRARILDDQELRAVWKAAGELNGPFGAFIKFVLLTACRRNEAARMTRGEVDNGIWTIPAARYKTKIDHVVPLSGAAVAVLAKLPRIGNSPHCFTTNGRNPIRGLAKFKSRLDAICGVTGWTIHDLRRTARSLMSRAGVSSDIAEICLGHTLGGVRATYDRHSYEQEKRRAFELLAREIERIVDPPQENVVPLVRGGPVS